MRRGRGRPEGWRRKERSQASAWGRAERGRGGEGPRPLGHIVSIEDWASGDHWEILSLPGIQSSETGSSFKNLWLWGGGRCGPRGGRGWVLGEWGSRRGDWWRQSRELVLKIARTGLSRTCGDVDLRPWLWGGLWKYVWGFLMRNENRPCENRPCENRASNFWLGPRKEPWRKTQSKLLSSPHSGSP